MLHEAVWNSLFIAASTTVISTLLGTLAAFPLVRCTFRFKRSGQLLVILPMIIPHFLMGVALLLFFAFVKMPLSRATIILGHVVFTLPFAVLIVSTRLYGFDRTLERAAGDLGADPLRTFWHVTLPLILPGVVGAALLVFTLSMDEFLITYFVSGQKGTLTMYIWSLLKDGIAPRVNALASVLLGRLVRAAAGRRVGARPQPERARRARRPPMSAVAPLRDAAPADAAVELRRVTKSFGAAIALDGIDLVDPQGRVLLAARPERLRQDDDPEPDRRLRDRHAAARCSSTAARCRTRPRTSGRSTPCSRAMPSSRT